MASTLGLGALADVAAPNKLLDGRGEAREGVSSLDEVARLGGAPVSGQHTRMVVADDFLDARRGDNDLVDSPDATMFEVVVGSREPSGAKY